MHRCPDHLDFLDPVRDYVHGLVEQGMAVITPKEYEYLIEGRVVNFGDNDVEFTTLPMPPKPQMTLMGLSNITTYEEYRQNEDLRRAVVLPRSEYAKLLEAKYPNSVSLQAAIKEPPYTWAPSGNFTNANRTSADVMYFIVHTTEGEARGSRDWLRNPQSQASCHPITAKDGTSWVLVADEDIAWTAGHSHFNSWGDQIEQGDYWANNGGFTEATYQLTAKWAAYYLYTHKIPAQLAFDPSPSYSGQKGGAYRAGIMGHHHVPFPSTHTDPGPHYDFEKLLSYTKKVLNGENPGGGGGTKPVKGSYILGKYNLLANAEPAKETSVAMTDALRIQLSDSEDMKVVKQAHLASPEKNTCDKIGYASKRSYDSPSGANKIYAVVIGPDAVDCLDSRAVRDKLLSKPLGSSGHINAVGTNEETTARKGLEALIWIGRREGLDVKKLEQDYLKLRGLGELSNYYPDLPRHAIEIPEDLQQKQFVVRANNQDIGLFTPRIKSESPDDEPNPDTPYNAIVGKSRVSKERMHQWLDQASVAQIKADIRAFAEVRQVEEDLVNAALFAVESNGAHARTHDWVDLFWQWGTATGIRPDFLIAQAMLETGWGYFTGKVPPEYNNVAGIKIKNPGLNDVREDHEQFSSWSEGIRAHANHLCAYTGQTPVKGPNGEAIHDRYFVVKSLSWAGTVKTTDGLDGRYAPREDYSELLHSRFLDPLVGEVGDGDVKFPGNTIWGVKTPEYIVGFGYPSKVQGTHRGEDVVTTTGADIRALADGKVLKIWDNGSVGGYNQAIIVEYPKYGVDVLYGHVKAGFFPFKTGDTFRRWDVIAKCGTLADALNSVPHPHVQVGKKENRSQTLQLGTAFNNTAIDPRPVRMRMGEPDMPNVTYWGPNGPKESRRKKVVKMFSSGPVCVCGDHHS
jgi:murein DD-endopeptidase MepM/ murein hydrolase activator NlpD